MHAPTCPVKMAGTLQRLRELPLLLSKLGWRALSSGFGFSRSRHGIGPAMPQDPGTTRAAHLWLTLAVLKICRFACPLKT